MIKPTLYFTTLQTPVGTAYIEGNERAITRVCCVPAHILQDVQRGEQNDNLPVLREARAELEGYFYHGLKEFSVPLHLAGSSFDKKVWDALKMIPYGHAATYGDVAHAIGHPRAARAVGGACNRNPVWIMIPCHRVIGADKSLRGYAGGIDKKHWLLNHEQCMLKRDA